MKLNIKRSELGGTKNVKEMETIAIFNKFFKRE